MNCIIVSIGDELLIGQTINTNAGWMGMELNKHGVEVTQVLTISDDFEAIKNAMAYGEANADVVLITGGLGPTKDDITKKTFADYFNVPLVQDKAALENVISFFKKYGREILPVNELQALVPEGCEMLLNKKGTAPGMWMERNNTIFVSMPGVPYEMKYLMEAEVIPRIVQRFELPFIVHETMMTQGLGESFIADRIEDIEENLPSVLKLAYLPSPGIVKLRLSGRGSDEAAITARIKEVFAQIAERIEGHVFSMEEADLHELLANILIEKRFSLSTAESCTGGTIASVMTSLPGSSQYFTGATVAYANAVKVNELNVAPSDLDKYGAVSEAVVKQMAIGAKKKYNTDFAIATSGIAGPDGGTEEKPVGTVWIAIATPDAVFAEQHQMGKGREKVVKKSVRAALGSLLNVLKGY